MYGDARKTNTPLTRSDYYVYAAKTQRGNDGIVKFTNYSYSPQKKQHYFNFCCSLIDYGKRHN